MPDTQQKVSGRKNTKYKHKIPEWYSVFCVHIILFHIIIQFSGEMLKGIILIEDTEGQFRTQFYILRAEMQFVKNSYPYALAW